MVKNYALFFVLLLFAMATHAQFSVKGKLVDETTQGIAFANIILNRAADNTNIKGSTTDDEGVFTIENITEDKYVLKVSYLGFESQQFTLLVNSDIDLGNIELSQTSQSLDEVTVTASKPTLERKVDRLVFNVENTTLSNGDSWNLLSNTPSLLQINGELLVRGRETPVVYINDRKVHLTSAELKQFLEGTPANVIKSVEVITNPPARYDAEGGAVINIVTSKNIITGYNGSIFSEYTQGNLPRMTVGTSHFYKTDKINLFGSYSYNNTQYIATFLEDITFLSNGTTIGSWDTDIKRKTRREAHNASLNLDVFLAPKHTLSLSSNLSLNPYSLEKTSSFTQAVDSTFTAATNRKTDSRNMSFNLGYKWDLDDSGQKITTNAFYVDSDKNADQTVITIYNNLLGATLNSNAFLNASYQITKVYAGQVDYIKPFESSTFEFGLKATKVKTESELDQDRILGTPPELNDFFQYDETNLAAYTSLEKNWDNWDIKLGLRGENTSLEGVSQSTNQTNTQDYFQLFPTLYLNHQVSDNYSFNLQYAKRIDRPNYNELNPFRYYFNDNSFQVGNPKLQPAIDHKIIFGHNYKAHSFELYYIYRDNPVYEISFQDNTKKQIQYIYANVVKNINYGIDYYSYIDITDFWSLNSLLSVFHDEDHFIALEDNNEQLVNGRWVSYISFNNYFTFLKDKSLTADLWLYYMSPVSWGGTGTQSELRSVNLGLTKTFLDKKATLTLQANDIFNTFGKLTVKNKYLSQRHVKASFYDEQAIGLRFTYKFGNSGLTNNQKDINLEEKDRIN